MNRMSPLGLVTPLGGFAVFAIFAAFGTFWASPAEASSGLYLQLGLGYGQFSGSELVVFQTPEAGDIPDIDPDRCCAGPGLAAQGRVGFSILGFGGPEFMFLGHGFDGFRGGAGFIGGGLRAFPLKFISLLGLDTSGFPLDIGLGAALGYSVVGKDFAYTGTYWDFDISVEYWFGSVISAGIKLDIVAPNYSDFVYSDYKKGLGRCLDTGANQDLDNYLTPVTKGAAQCSGRGPSTTFVTPQLVVTFHFNFLDV